MPSTNKTTGLELNQYVATDKPTMADYNADMLKIDAEVARTNTLLWQGSADVGDTITVPNFDKYALFKVTVSGHGTPLRGGKHGNFFRGGGENAPSASSVGVYGFNATFSGGNILTIIGSTYIVLPSMTVTNPSITSIAGII